MLVRTGGKAPLTFVFGLAILFLVVLLNRYAASSGMLPNTTTIKNSFAASFGTGRSVKAFMDRSERLWQKTVQQRHELRDKNYNGQDIGFFPARDGPSYFTWYFSIWDLIPASYNCPHEIERIGRMGDGGKWVCGMHRYETKKPCILYSFGIQNESSFEQEMLERTNCEIFGYDFSVSDFGKALKPEFSDRAHFKQAGISGVSKPQNNPPFYTIQDLMAQNGHDYIDILKIDIEYAEFDALSSLNAWANGNMEFPIGQMLIEIHLFQNQPITPITFLDWWGSLEARGLRPVWTEPNLLAVTIHLEDSQPRLAEYSLINIHDKRNVLYH
ncbi:hypothetical protein BP6252_04651 [Coleophoma cylindrospora]|uniref:Methyltransferase domain-containing protein n=1 Tax=Coleophoma cylindrospora TaxID=1849047 RepID=A0A3D8S124_9HELO|nr:hypothetical protein BP6252_04651 [Coleophoma cylindrospora]